MPHLIQLEYSIEEVGILSDSRSEPCVADLLKAERVEQSHALQTIQAQPLPATLKATGGCCRLAIIEYAAATTWSIEFNLRITWFDIIAYGDTCAQDACVVTHYSDFRCNKLFHII